VLGPALTDLLAETGIDGVVVPSALRGDPALGVMLAGLGEAYARGHAVDWARVQPRGRHTDLPLYPWQGRRHWVRPPHGTADLAGEVQTYDPHVTAPEESELVATATAAAVAALAQIVGDDVRFSQLRTHGSVTPGSPLRVVLLPSGGGWRFAVRAEESSAGGLSRWTPVLSGQATPTVDVPEHDVPESTPTQAVGDWFVGAVGSLLDSDHVDRARPLPELGMDSVLATKLLARVHSELGVRLPTRALLGANTVDAVIRELDRVANLTK
jgi:acyl transferase domain-containing protein